MDNDHLAPAFKFVTVNQAYRFIAHHLNANYLALTEWPHTKIYTQIQLPQQFETQNTEDNSLPLVKWCWLGGYGN